MKLSSIFEYMVGNRIAALLGTIGLLVLGFVALNYSTVERYPPFDLRRITVTVPYDGATPSEVEEDVLRRIEESLSRLDGVDRITANAWQGKGEVIIEFKQWQDTIAKLELIRTAVEGIEDFPPAGADRPEIVHHEILRGSLSLVLTFADASEEDLTQVANHLREQLLFLPDVAVVDIYGARERQIQIDLDENKLLAHHLTVDDIADKVRASSVNLHGGELSTPAGKLVVGVHQKRITAAEFADIVVLSKPDGSILRLRDVGTIQDGFVDEPLISTVNGVPAVFIEVRAPNGVDPKEVRDEVDNFLSTYNPAPGMNLEPWMDNVFSVKKPLLSVADSAMVGGALVLIVLVLLLDLRLGIWVAIGIPTAIIGACSVLYLLGITLNIMAVIGFAVVIGIVVDDAIVVAENIDRHRDAGLTPMEASVKGAREVMSPVTVGVLTTIFVFAALLPLDGVLGILFGAMAAVVIIVLLFSLLDAFLLLPAHVSGTGELSASPLREWQQYTRNRFSDFIEHRVGAVIKSALRHPLLAVASFAVIVSLAFWLLVVDVIRFNTTGNRLDEQQLQLDLTMTPGTSFETTANAIEHIANAAQQAHQTTGSTAINAINVLVGEHKALETAIGANLAEPAPHLGSVQLRLNTYPSREVSVAELRKQWLDEIGSIAGLETVAFPSATGYSSAGIAFVLTHPDEDDLLSAARELKQKLLRHPPIYQVDDTLELGDRHYEIELTDAARAAGLTSASVAAQLKNRFYGFESDQLLRDLEEIQVVTRYPLQQRLTQADLEDELIRLPNGEMTSFVSQARLVETQELVQRQRINGVPAVTFNALYNVQATSSRELGSLVLGEWFTQLVQKYPQLSVLPDGSSRDTAKILSMLGITFPAALIGLFVIMAILLRSFIQPVYVMLGLPIAISGSLYLHLALGYDVGLVSIFGAIAATGVIVNDALVLLDVYNRIRRDDANRTVSDAITEAALLRAKPIVLTTITTIVGLMPLLYNRAESVEPFLPVVVSLVGGLTLAAIGLLLVLPACLVVVEQINKQLLEWRNGLTTRIGFLREEPS